MVVLIPSVASTEMIKFNIVIDSPDKRGLKADIYSRSSNSLQVKSIELPGILPGTCIDPKYQPEIPMKNVIRSTMLLASTWDQPMCFRAN